MLSTARRFGSSPANWNRNPKRRARNSASAAGPERAEVDAVDEDRSRGGPAEAADQAEERRLARARPAADGEELTRLDIQVHPGHRSDRAA